VIHVQETFRKNLRNKLMFYLLTYLLT